MIRPGIRRIFRLAVWRRDVIQRDVEDEMELHLDLRRRQLIDDGRTPEESEREAIRRFGALDPARRSLHLAANRREHRMQWHEQLTSAGQDARYALRALRANPAFTWTAVASLALGIGANVAIFTMINAVLLRPLPFPRAGDLYRVWSANHEAKLDHAWTSPPTFADWRGQRQRIADMGGYLFVAGGTGVDLVGSTEPQRLGAAFITPGFFSTFGMAPEVGRLPREDELARGGENHVVVLAWSLWTHRFGQSRSILDSTVTLSSGSYRVIGVMPQTFRYPADGVDIYVPYAVLTEQMVPWRRDVHTLNLVARGRPGTTLPEVRTEMRTIASRNARAHVEETGWDDATVVPLQQVTTGAVRPSLLILGGAVAFVLLMACVNLASLLLARGASRERELAIRVALGASGWRVARQLLTESLLIAAAGGAASVAVAIVALRLLTIAGIGNAVMRPEVHFDGASVAAALGLSLLTCVIFGAVPAIRSASTDPQDAMRAGGRNAVGSGRLRLRGGLVVGEIALAFMLAASAGLMAKTFLHLTRENLGFRTDHLVTATMNIDIARHADSSFGRYYEQVLTQLRTEPGLQSLVAIRTAPLQGPGEDAAFLAPGQAPRPAAELPAAPLFPVSDHYFATIGTNVMQGREFLPTDRKDTPLVAIVNQAFVDRYIGNARTLDQTLLIGGRLPVRIVGVVANIRQSAIDEPPVPTMYVPYLQSMRSQVTFLARTTQPLAALQSIRHAIHSVDRDQAITAMSTFDDVRDGALAQSRTIATLLIVFGLVGLSLGATGVYGVLAFLVTERRREIGVRIALGAPTPRVLRLVMRRGMLLAGAGLVIGTGGALLATRALRGLLYGVSPTDALTFGSVAVVLAGVSAAAGWLPARRAARISPLEAIRE